MSAEPVGILPSVQGTAVFERTHETEALQQEETIRRSGESQCVWMPREILGTAPIRPICQGQSQIVSTRTWPIERWMLSRLLHSIQGHDLEIELWDGTVIRNEFEEAATYRIRILQRSALWKLLGAPEYFFPEGYALGQIEIDGDLLGLVCFLNQRWRLHEPNIFSSWVQHQFAIRRRNAPDASLKNVEHHYDLGNDFYQLWLDEQCVYTCGYFPQSGMTLEDGQVAKMNHICCKLRLQPGDRVVEAGCGWGALALHMARTCGVRVRAYNVSKEQLEYARWRARKLGLSNQVEFIEDDWRHIHDPCDAFVSVGMLEHVGPEHFRRLGQIIRDSLSSNGRGLIHSIAQNLPLPLNPWIERHIFPGAEPPTLEQMTRIFTAGDLVINDVENLRLHYAETLWHWLERFDRSLDEIVHRFGPEFVRRWQMYLALSYSAFETGGLQLYQVVFTPGVSNQISRSRADWYSAAVSGTSHRNCE